MHVDSRPTRWLARLVLLVPLVVSAGLEACLATPIPDPPSLDPARMSLVAEGETDVRLTGTAGAVSPGARALRVTNPAAITEPTHVEVFADADGSLRATLAGTTSDTLYLEGIDATTQTFELAVRLQGGAVVAADPGGDRDADGSPDAIDCAPDDPLFVGRGCAASCSTDSDCGSGQSCVAGLCVVSGCAIAETCGNGLDDDCDGTADDGC